MSPAAFLSHHPVLARPHLRFSPVGPAEKHFPTRPPRPRARRCRSPPAALDSSAGAPESPTHDGEALTEAALFGDTPTVDRLLREGTSPSYVSAKGGMTALMLASAEGHLEIVRLLLAAGADVNAATALGNSALLYAVENLRSAHPRQPPPPGFPARDMLSSTTKADVPPQTPVFAKRTAHPDIIRSLIAEGANIRVRNDMDETLLHVAARRAQDGIVREFLAMGLDVNAKSMGFQETPLHVAAKEDHVDIVNLLCDVGADMEAKSRFGWTPLLWAAASGWESVVECLIKRGADVNVQASYNAQVTSPLKEARRCSRPVSICNMLIRAGAVE